MARRRALSPFSLSFLDVMASGLGAVVLVFLIINHSVEVRATGAERDVARRVAELEQRLVEKRDAAQRLVASLSAVRDETRAARERTERLAQELGREAPDARPRLRARRERIAALEQELKSIEGEVRELRRQAEEGNATRRYVGEGNRQYLTALKVGGRHVLILVDASASMLDETVVGVIRRRNMDEARKMRAPKWRRTLDTVDWITTQVPADARFQLYTFNTEARAVLSGTDGRWVGVDAGRRLTEAVRALRDVVPKGGTSLHRALGVITQLEPKPDNVFLVTDGLPTQGRAGTRRGLVSAEERLQLYIDARGTLPRGVPVNVILLPMEGDPIASAAFWRLAQIAGGSFLTPSRDWP